MPEFSKAPNILLGSLFKAYSLGHISFISGTDISLFDDESFDETFIDSTGALFLLLICGGG